MLAALLLSAVAPLPATVRVDFDRGGVTRVRTAGLADHATRRPVTADDPVRVASISKLVTTIAVMRLVDRRRLDLDADVSAVLGWRLRNPRHPDVPITLRLLLSHLSSLSDGIDYALPFDATVRAALADPKAWDADHAPGTYFRYANIGFPVVAAVMERATGERFDRLLQRLVSAPLRIDACFNWTTCSDAALARAVVLYDPTGRPVRDDLHGRRPDCPIVPARDGGCNLGRWRAGANGASFSPQGGLRISMRDLAKVGRLLLSDGRVDGVRLLSTRSVAMMRTPAWRYDGTNGDTSGGIYCAYGLGTELIGRVAGCADDPFGDSRPRSGHAGDAYRLKSALWLDRVAGTGTGWFTTQVPEDTPRGRSGWTAAEEIIALSN